MRCMVQGPLELKLQGHLHSRPLPFLSFVRQAVSSAGGAGVWTMPVGCRRKGRHTGPGCLGWRAPPAPAARTSAALPIIGRMAQPAHAGGTAGARRAAGRDSHVASWRPRRGTAACLWVCAVLPCCHHHAPPMQCAQYHHRPAAPHLHWNGKEKVAPAQAGDQHVRQAQAVGKLPQHAYKPRRGAAAAERLRARRPGTHGAAHVGPAGHALRGQCCVQQGAACSKRALSQTPRHTQEMFEMCGGPHLAPPGHLHQVQPLSGRVHRKHDLGEADDPGPAQVGTGRASGGAPRQASRAPYGWEGMEGSAGGQGWGCSVRVGPEQMMGARGGRRPGPGSLPPPRPCWPVRPARTACTYRLHVAALYCSHLAPVLQVELLARHQHHVHRLQPHRRHPHAGLQQRQRGGAQEAAGRAGRWYRAARERPQRRRHAAQGFRCHAAPWQAAVSRLLVRHVAEARHVAEVEEQRQAEGRQSC